MPSLQRTKDQLPAELFQKDSELDQMVSIAGSAVEKKLFLSEQTVILARRQLSHACPDYRPSLESIGDVLCGSGELTGNPIRQECLNCRVSQFTKTGLFIGDLVPVSTLFQQEAL